MRSFEHKYHCLSFVEGTQKRLITGQFSMDGNPSSDSNNDTVGHCLPCAVQIVKTGLAVLGKSGDKY